MVAPFLFMSFPFFTAHNSKCRAAMSAADAKPKAQIILDVLSAGAPDTVPQLPGSAAKPKGGQKVLPLFFPQKRLNISDQKLQSVLCFQVFANIWIEYHGQNRPSDRPDTSASAAAQPGQAAWPAP